MLLCVELMIMIMIIHNIYIYIHTDTRVLYYVCIHVCIVVFFVFSHSSYMKCFLFWFVTMQTCCDMFENSDMWQYC